MDLKILLLVTVLAVSATATTHQKKRPSILESFPSVLKPVGAFKRMAAAAKVVKRTSGLKDKETCDNCLEILNDIHDLLRSDVTNDNIDAMTPVVCFTKYS